MLQHVVTVGGVAVDESGCLGLFAAAADGEEAGGLVLLGLRTDAIGQQQVVARIITEGVPIVHAAVYR